MEDSALETQCGMKWAPTMRVAAENVNRHITWTIFLSFIQQAAAASKSSNSCGP